jgi:hypothetical protein
MREQLASALHSKNLQQKENHCNLDVIHALGIAAIESPIGAAIIRFDSLQPHAYNELIYQLQKKAARRLKCDKQILLRVCQQIVHESLFKFCTVCLGRKEALLNKKVIICGECKGTGLHRHTDMHRAKAIKVSFDEYIKHWAHRLTIVQAIYSSEHQNALRIAGNKSHD